MKMDKKTLWVLVILLVGNVDAVRVGVVVEFPDADVFTKCLSVDEDTNGYDVMQETGLDIGWSDPSEYGHAMCRIEDIGCPSSNCWCEYPSYWNFYIKSGDDSWSYSPVGFDGGESCSEHYCAKEEDVLGFAYGGYGTEPSDIPFADVCCTLLGNYAPCGEVTLTEVVDFINLWTQSQADLGDVIDLINVWASG